MTGALVVAIRSVRRALWRHAGRFLTTTPLRFGREPRSDRPSEYLVLWEIFVEAGSAEEAAREALAAQRNPESRADVFEVRDERGRWETVHVGRLEPGGRRLRLVKGART